MVTTKDENRKDISTHAPAQGATRVRMPPHRDREFQPTLPHRERRHTAQITAVATPFQPTLPHRERRPDLALSIWDGKISTHAPAQGATRSRSRKRRKRKYFNPRSRTGSDVLDL